MNHAKAAAGEFRVAAALLLRGAFQQGDSRSLFGRGKGRAQRSVPPTRDYDIITIGHFLHAHAFHIMERNSIYAIRVERVRRIHVNTAVIGG
jgi:hypothetical protein